MLKNQALYRVHCFRLLTWASTPFTVKDSLFPPFWLTSTFLSLQRSSQVVESAVLSYFPLIKLVFMSNLIFH
uniref:Uncharacterized protein n=1 Tax=Manihot esculenta TaxID=3983 RepID=A0A2C9UFX5_MANES